MLVKGFTHVCTHDDTCTARPRNSHFLSPPGTRTRSLWAENLLKNLLEYRSHALTTSETERTAHITTNLPASGQGSAQSSSPPKPSDNSSFCEVCFYTFHLTPNSIPLAGLFRTVSEDAFKEYAKIFRRTTPRTPKSNL